MHGIPTREYPCSASVFKQGTLVVGVAIPGAVFGETVSINYRIPLVLFASRKETVTVEGMIAIVKIWDCVFIVILILASQFISQACYRDHMTRWGHILLTTMLWRPRNNSHYCSQYYLILSSRSSEPLIITRTNSSWNLEHNYYMKMSMWARVGIPCATCTEFRLHWIPNLRIEVVGIPSKSEFRAYTIMHQPSLRLISWGPQANLAALKKRVKRATAKCVAH